MSKKKKKKKNDRTKVEFIAKKDRKPFAICIAFIFAFVFAYYMIYMHLSAFVKPFYFITTRYNSVYLIVLFLLLFSLIVTYAYFSAEKKTRKKILLFSAPILIIYIATTVIYSSAYWTFNENSFSYGTLFQKNKIVYSYDDIEYYDLTLEPRSQKFQYMKYELHLKNGEQIAFNAMEGSFNEPKNLIDFDKKIADKRRKLNAPDDFFYYEPLGNEINTYYHSIL